MNVAGEIAVITGGASGIGRGTALALARAGADIALADVNDDRLAGTRTEIEALGRRAIAVHCDVSVEAEVLALAHQVEVELGPPGIVMNNAGVVLRGALEQIELRDWQWCLGINVFGVIHGIRAFLPGMIARGHGYMVNTGSMSGMVAFTGEGAPYIASKFAVNGLTEALALYAAPFGVGVSLLCPGGVNTNLAETGRSVGMTPEREQAETRMAQNIQGGVEMEPREIGEYVLNAIREDQYLILPDPFHADLVRRRGQDIDAFVAERLRAIRS